MGGGQSYQGNGNMPVYEYQCLDCGEVDQRVGGLDDQTAICVQCGSLMLRLDEDVFQAYFENRDELTEVSVPAEIGDFLEETRSGGHVHGEPLLLRLRLRERLVLVQRQLRRFSINSTATKAGPCRLCAPASFTAGQQPDSRQGQGQSRQLAQAEVLPEQSPA